MTSWDKILLQTFITVVLVCSFYIIKWNYIHYTTERDLGPQTLVYKGTITHKYQKTINCGSSETPIRCPAYYFILDNKKEHKVISETYMTYKVGYPVVLEMKGPRKSDFYEKANCLTLFSLFILGFGSLVCYGLSRID